MKQKTNFAYRSRPVIFLILIFGACCWASHGQTTAFTYQGRLNDSQTQNGTGSYLMEFRLFAEASGGSPIQTLSDVPVSVVNNVFAVQLNFTAQNAFDGANRFLEIAVKRQAGETYATLAPRQPLTSAPYAIRALNAGSVQAATAGNSVVNAINNVATNTVINSERLSADVVRLKPTDSQNSTSGDENAPLLDITGTVVDGENVPLFARRFLMSFDGSFGIFKDTANVADPIFKLNADSGLVVGGEYTSGFPYSIPAEGAGARMMWYPGRAAFRAGVVNGTQWDEFNVGNGSVAFGENARASGNYSAAFGRNTIAASDYTFAAGDASTASGTASVALGYRAHTNAQQGSFVFSDRSSTDNFFANLSQTANWRVTNGFRIYTSSNLSTGVTFQSGASPSNWCNGQANAVISTSTCAYLSTGGTWTNASSRDLKTNFAAVDSREILNKVLKLPISTWNYKSENASVRHIGAMSQDFAAAFKFGDNERNISTVDADGVALAAIQGLHAELNERAEKLESENKLLKEQLKTQAAQTERQQKQIEELKQIVCAIKPDAGACSKEKK